MTRTVTRVVVSLLHAGPGEKVASSTRPGDVVPSVRTGLGAGFRPNRTLSLARGLWALSDSAPSTRKREDLLRPFLDCYTFRSNICVKSKRRVFLLFTLCRHFGDESLVESGRPQNKTVRQENFVLFSHH